VRTPAIVTIPEMLARPLRGLWHRPFFLLVFTTFFWGGNVVAGRLAVGEVSPMAVTFLRWAVSFTLLAFIARRQVMAEYKLVLPKWRLILLLGVLGYTAFNALFYSAAHHTSGVNIAIIQGSTPIVILLFGFIVFRNSLTGLQLVGAVMTIVGVVVTASKGDWRVIATLAFNRGDVWLLIASIFYAAYALLLVRKPACSTLVFFTALAAAAALTSMPLILWEWQQGQLLWPSPKGWLLVAYIAIFPSLLCQIFFIRGIELIGPGRASIVYNLVPVFGALLATVVLREPLLATDIVALALVIGGILIAEKGRAKG
jgi:drug/metabolite transporter (DMT)-like permease